jgi:hypothetical protein
MSDDSLEHSEEREAKVQERRLVEAIDRDTELEQLKALLAMEPMRDFVWRLLSRCHVYRSVYNKNFGDMALAEGARQIGLWLLSELAEANPDALLEMQLKANRIAQAEAAKERSRRRRPSATP